MVDKVKPLKIEDTTSGTEFDMVPTETNPSEDYLAAKGIAFENSDNTTIEGDSGVMKFKDTDVTTQVSLQELVSSASPGFLFAFPGNNPSGSWAEIYGVPSNRVGIPILQNNPELTAAAIYNETDPNTFSVEIYEHDGTVFTLITTISVTSDRGITSVFGSPFTLTQGKELAAKVSSGSVKNGILTCILSGDVI